MNAELFYEAWREHGRPRCEKCGKPVLYGHRHECKQQRLVKTAAPKRWPL